MDKSNGYESIADIYLAGRGSHSGGLGAAHVSAWAKRLPPGASILDVGCGSGVPISEVLIQAGFDVFGVDASPSMVAAFRKRFPKQQVECCAVEDSAFLNRKFDAVVSWGLMFLLSADAQRSLIAKMARALQPGGRLLFTAPAPVCHWLDAMTGQASQSLGRLEYSSLIRAAGLIVEGEEEDAGENHYYFAAKI